MRSSVKRISILWPVLIFAVLALWLVQTFGAVPAPLADILSRSWPALLIAAGFVLLIGRRFAFSNFVALGLAVLITAGIAAFAYRQQSSQFATDNQVPFTQSIDPAITSVKINVDTNTTEIDVKPGSQSVISGEFVGSQLSQLTPSFQMSDTSGTLTLTETQKSGFAALTSVGRGKLTLLLPTNLPLSLQIGGRSGNIQVDGAGTSLTDVTITSGGGTISLTALPASVANLTLNASTGSLDIDGSAASLQNVTVTANAGNISLKLPNQSGLIATLKASGDIAVTVPPSITATFKLLNAAVNNLTYNQSDYVLTADKNLISRLSNEPQMHITLDSGGKVVVQ